MEIIRKRGGKLKITHSRKIFYLIIVLVLFLIVLIISLTFKKEYSNDKASIHENYQEIPSDTIYTEKTCLSDTDCIPATCCHASSCTLKEKTPICSNIMCTMECVPGTMDCGQGACACVDGECKVIIK